jgi:hypothetical protein
MHTELWWENLNERDHLEDLDIGGKKVKLSPCVTKDHAMKTYPTFNDAPRHKDVLGKRRYGSTHS